MPRYRVVTDSSCDIPDALIAQFGIAVAPLSVHQAGEPVRTAPEARTAGEADRTEDGASGASVLAPRVEDFSRLYRSLREQCDGILSIHVSSKLSETVANASMAREIFGPVGQGGPFPVAVVDSLSMSMGLGWIVLTMAHAAHSGIELHRLAAMATRMRGQSHVAFVADQLGGLIGTGGAPKLAAQEQSLAGLKPLLHLDEGQVVVYERTRTRAKARDALYNFVEDFPKIGELAVFHTGAQNDLEHLLTRIGAIYPRERILILQPGAAVAAWLGPQAVGVAVLEGEE